MNDRDLIFGLDIGTRTVVGVVGYNDLERFVILAMEIVEHDSRAMMDGQIHDIGEVAKAVGKVKQKLEEKLGCELKEVAIAAAGRSLKTYQVSVENELDTVQITNKDIRTLEIDGVTVAEEKLKQELNDNHLEYFCVAHTVINYYLDGYVIANLEGHKGRKIGADVIATFLPKTVVDSLYAVVNRNNLSVTTLTLEPIAAINVAIPEKLRLINLCLLDIGAGTSDIAITRDGSITAYGMIPNAGDEITEKIVHNYLVDFATAERIKIECGVNDTISFDDILGTNITVTKEEVLKVLEPVINELTVQIATKIKELNSGRTPNAAFCVGGGGQVLGFSEKLAAELGLPAERVALRSSKLIENIDYMCEPIEGTNMVTPIGICVTSINQKGYNFIEVKLNGETVKLLNARKLKIMDAGIVKEYNHKNLIGRKGKDLKFILNGKSKKIIGEMGVQAEILLNDRPADLETPIKDGDLITIKKASNGKDATKKIEELLNSNSELKVSINDEMYTMKSKFKINGQEVESDTEIKNDDNVEIHEIRRIGDLTKEYVIDVENSTIYVNNKLVSKSHLIKDGDSIYFERINNETKKNEKFIEKNFTKANNNVIIMLNGQALNLQQKEIPHMFVDLFNYIDVESNNKKGKLSMKLNGMPVSLTDIIKDGDIAEIHWNE